MMSIAITFDTLKYANKLKAAGLEPKLAEAQAQAEGEALHELAMTQLATKLDIYETKQEITKLKEETCRDISALREETSRDINELKQETRQKIGELTFQVHGLRISMDQLKNTLTIKLGGIMVAGIGVLGALLTFFHI